MNEYFWHESLRRLARGVSSLHQHQNTEKKKNIKKNPREVGGRKGKKGGGKADRHTL